MSVNVAVREPSVNIVTPKQTVCIYTTCFKHCLHLFKKSAHVVHIEKKRHYDCIFIKTSVNYMYFNNASKLCVDRKKST